MFNFIILILLSHPSYAEKAQPPATHQGAGTIHCKASAVGALADKQLSGVKKVLAQRLDKLGASKKDSRQAFLFKKGLQNSSFLNIHHENDNPSQDVSQLAESMKALF